jgi:hypothetical protein
LTNCIEPATFLAAFGMVTSNTSGLSKKNKSAMMAMDATVRNYML